MRTKGACTPRGARRQPEWPFYALCHSAASFDPRQLPWGRYSAWDPSTVRCGAIRRYCRPLRAGRLVATRIQRQQVASAAPSDVTGRAGGRAVAAVRNPAIYPDLLVPRDGWTASITPVIAPHDSPFLINRSR